MPVRFITLGLAALLLLVQAELWFGRHGVGRVVELRGQLGQQLSANAEALARNDRFGAELRDLKEGLEMVEEKARFDLGMVKPDEILVQYTPAR